MNAAIATLNEWGAAFLHFAGAMLWQSSLLAVVILLVDFSLRRRVRAAVRHGLWLVLLVKLILPPSLALPTSPAWWWSRRAPEVVHFSVQEIQPANYVVTENDSAMPETMPASLPEARPPRPPLTLAAWCLLVAGVGSLGLLVWLVLRYRKVLRAGRLASSAPELEPLLGEATRLAGIRPRSAAVSAAAGRDEDELGTSTKAPSRGSDLANLAAGARDNMLRLGTAALRGEIRVRISRDTMSPAVCGLFRPVILLPQALVETLSPEQLRAVLLHELTHVRRGDVWVNCAQGLLQIVYWWHPLVWLANARIRRVREEAVDDAVMVALRADAEIYAPTLLAVARFALQRPLASLGLVGILESRSALRERIERLVNLPVPRKAGLSFFSVFGLLMFSAVALPMGDGPALPPTPASQPVSPGQTTGDTAGTDTNLYSLSFMLDTNSLWPAVLGANPLGTNFMRLPAAVENNVRMLGFFQQRGVDLHVPKQMIYAEDSWGGHMYVKATADDLDKVKLILAPFQSLPGDEHTNDSHLGLDWYFGQFGSMLVPAAKSNYEAGKLDDAEAIIQVALQHNPTNRAARYYLDLIKEARRDQERGVSNVLSSAQFMPPPAESTPANLPLQAFILLSDSGLPKFRQETGFTTNNTQADYLAAFSNLLPSGVFLPTNSLWFDDQGILLVQGTPEELAAVEQLFQRLNADSKSHPRSPANHDVAATHSQKTYMVPAGETMRLPGGGVTNLYLRTFKVNPKIFKPYLQNALGESTSAMPVRELFGRFGVHLTPPKVWFFNDGLGLLFVKATSADLEVIERIVESLNQPVTADRSSERSPIKAASAIRFAESKDAGSADFEALFTKVPSAPATISGIQSNPNFQTAIHALEQRRGSENLAEPETTTTSGRQVNQMAVPQSISFPLPPQLHVQAYFLEVTGALTNVLALLNSADGKTASGILEDGPVRKFWHEFAAVTNDMILGEPEATTTSGRHVQMRMRENTAVVTEIRDSPQRGPSDPARLSEFIDTTNLDTGRVLDVVPKLGTDGRTIEMTATVDLTEFGGYDGPMGGGMVPTPYRLPKPFINKRRLAAQVKFQAGQTIILYDRKPRFVALRGSVGDSMAQHLVVLVTVSLGGSASPENGPMFDPVY